MTDKMEQHEEIVAGCDYREAKTNEGKCRTCHFAVFTDEGVICDLYEVAVDGNCRCNDQR